MSGPKWLEIIGILHKEKQKSKEIVWSKEQYAEVIAITVAVFSFSVGFGLISLQTDK